MSDISFLPKALEAIANSKSGMASVARNVLLQDVTREPAVAYQILGTYVELQDARSSAKKNNEGYTGIKPERLLSLHEALMNQVCWHARKQIVAQQIAEDTDLQNGIDYSQDTADITGVYTETKNIPEIVCEDYKTMLAIYGYLKEKMHYLDGVKDAIAMFSIKEPQPKCDDFGNVIKNAFGEDETEWVYVTECGNWEDALEAMTEQVTKLSDQPRSQEINKSQEVQELDKLLGVS